MRKYFGEIGLLITAIIWGSGFVASAVSLDYYTPYQILEGRFLIGALLLSVIFHKKLKGIKKSTLAKGALLGTFLYIAFALQTIGLQYTTPSKNAFLTSVNVIIVPFIGFILYKKKINLFELCGAVLAMLGVAVLSLKLTSEINSGDLLTLGCAVAFAFHIFYTSKYVKDEDPVLLTLIQMAVATGIGFIVVVAKGEMSFSVESAGFVPLIYLGIFSTTLGFLLQTVAQKFITETKAAIILSTESFWGMVFSVVILSEVLTFKIIVGAMLILSAIVISETKLSFIKKIKLKKVATKPPLL
ncbi:DMT family transporter [Filibacter tadaridae]|uniref:EamA-like transporter family protein n=1 Tax=Filibacter tadaridae TaxID=2483811 RepID=A0A3P5WN57_9BACL|nr:DMT family transporter [Filibacter tadaridae]VDC22392.1 EamA-like transporter family protein [Filibacter tadaridae]